MWSSCSFNVEMRLVVDDPIRSAGSLLSCEDILPFVAFWEN